MLSNAVTTAGLTHARLTNGNNANEGRLEVDVNNVWYPVCAPNWGKPEAIVACRNLNLNVYVLLFYNLPIRINFTKVWRGNTMC